MRKLRVSTGGSHRSRDVHNRILSWEELVQRCRKPKHTKETFAQFREMSKDEQSAVKSVGYIVGGQFKDGIRKIGNLQGRDVITLDIDHAPADFEFEIDLYYGGYAYLVHSTHSHVAKHPRLRIMFPLTRTITPDEYEPVARQLAQMVNIDWFDDTTFQASRLMFWPSVSQDGDWYVDEGQGDFVDPDEVLTLYGEEQEWQDASQWPVSNRKRGQLRRSMKHAADPLQKRGAVGAFCRAYPIEEAIAEFIPEAYEKVEMPHGSNARYSYTGSTTSAGAVIYDDKWLYSHHERDPVGGRLVNAFDLIRLHRFADLDESAKSGTPVIRKPSFHAMEELALTTEAVRMEIATEVFDGFEDVPEDNPAPPVEEGFEDVEDSKGKRPAWLSKLEFDKHKELVKSHLNLVRIIENDPATKGKLGLNTFARLPTFRENLPWRDCKDPINGDNWSDDDELLLLNYIAQKYKTEWHIKAIFQAVRTVMVQNPFNPVKDYLESLEWDGKPRLNTMLHDHLGVRRNPYSDAVSRKTMCAAVARIFDPGCKADYMLVIEGEQGKRKSGFIEALASRPWYTDGVSSLDTTRAIESMQGSWILEMDELVAFSKSQVEHEKAFLSRQVDKARLAYGRNVKTFKRQSVFIGTTNDEEYLKDSTGNRRVWPVRATVERIDIDKVLEVRDQLWAEAVVAYRAGEPLYLEDPEIEKHAVMEQQDRQLQDTMITDIEQYLQREAPVNRYLEDVEDGFEDELEPRDRVNYQEIWKYALGERGRPTRLDCKRIREAMAQLDDWKYHASVRFGKSTPRRGFVHRKHYR